MEIEELIRLINTVSASELTGMCYEADGVKLKLEKKKEKVVVAAPANMMGASGMQVQNTPANMIDTADSLAVTSANTVATDVQAVGQASFISGKEVLSPLVGTFYTAPSEDAGAFVKVGDTVKKGQTLAIVEAMKLMNEIESDFDGIVVEVLAENGTAVEYGQPLFKIQ